VKERIRLSFRVSVLQLFQCRHESLWNIAASVGANLPVRVLVIVLTIRLFFF